MDSPYRETPPLAEQLAEAQREIERLRRKPARRVPVVLAMVYAALAMWQAMWLWRAMASGVAMVAALDGAMLAWQLWWGCHWYTRATCEEDAHER